MRSKFPLLRRWRFSARVLAPVILLLIIAAATVVCFVAWAAADVDARSLERQSEQARNVINSELAQISHDQESVAIWDDSVVHTRLAFDPKWIDANLGVWMSTYFSHSTAFVLNGKNRAVYAMDKGKAADPGGFTTQLAAIAPLVVHLRKDIAAHTAGPGADLPPRVADLVNLNGRPSIVSVMPIVSDTGDIQQDESTAFLHVSVLNLDSIFAARIAAQYQLVDPTFSTTMSAAPDRTVLPLTNAAGRFVAFFEWTQYRPGQAMINQIAPALGGAFLIALVVVMLLLDQLWRSSTALDAGRISAQHLALHDVLTELPNRQSFDAELGRLIGGARPPGHSVSLLMLDLDRFKHVNDTLGHQAGDSLIRAVGQRLKELLGPSDVVARLGGDEFAIVHVTRGGARDALQLGQRIIEAIGKPFELNGSEAFVGVSIGLVLATPDETDRHEVTRKADIALFEAKAGGRNRIVVYEDAMNDLLQNRHTIEAELRDALRHGDQLSVAFQPLFSRDDGKITGAEALVRWTHPKLGQVSPAHFIPVAEASGLIHQLGEFVLARACELGARWPGRTIAVNISPAQLRNPDFQARVFALLGTTGMRAEDLELEITEGILLEDEHIASEALHAFREAGIRIALDDFGTGYSSLNYLKRYPVDRIKIDRSFVSQLAPDNVSAAIVQAMVTLAHALNIAVTAEGVETHQQMQILAGIGCNTFQGFLLSPPLPGPAVDQLFAESAAGPQATVAQVA